MGIISMQLFSEDVDSLEHPDVREFVAILERMAEVYGCHLMSFAIQNGVVMFAFDSEEITGDILEDLEEVTGQKPVIASSKEAFVGSTSKMLDEAEKKRLRSFLAEKEIATLENAKEAFNELGLENASLTVTAIDKKIFLTGRWQGKQFMLGYDFRTIEKPKDELKRDIEQKIMGGVVS